MEVNNEIKDIIHHYTNNIKFSFIERIKVLFGIGFNYKVEIGTKEEVNVIKTEINITFNKIIKRRFNYRTSHNTYNINSNLTNKK